MIYTFGRREAYDAHIASEENPQKIGRRLNYPGGTVWQTRREAQSYVNSLPNEDHPDWRAQDFAVYGVDANWKTDTYIHANEPYRSLLYDSRLLLLY